MLRVFWFGSKMPPKGQTLQTWLGSAALWNMDTLILSTDQDTGEFIKE